MPIYEYECTGCHCHFERRQGFDGASVLACPFCQGQARRLFHPVPIVFKGSGFYCTDHGQGSSQDSSPAPKKEETKVSVPSGEKSVPSGEKKEHG